MVIGSDRSSQNSSFGLRLIHNNSLSCLNNLMMMKNVFLLIDAASLIKNGGQRARLN